MALLIACLCIYTLFFVDIDLDENEEEMELMEKRVTGILKHSGVDDDDDNNDDDNDNDDNNNNNSDGNNGDKNDKDNSQHSSHSPNNSETKGGSKRVRNTVESNANDENMDTGNVINTETIVHEKKLKKKKIQIPAKEYEEMTQMLALHIKQIVSLC